jgi:hypothetical protein
MNLVQQVLGILFVVALAVTYRNELLSLVKRVLPGGCLGGPAKAEQSVALRVVGDIISVTELRDKLASEDCPQGVEACTNLLRVIVEHQVPAKGAV